MKKSYTPETIPAGYEVCGIGAAPEEDSLVVMSSEAIRKLRKPRLLRRLFSGPTEITGTGSAPGSSDIVDKELLKHL